MRFFHLCLYLSSQLTMRLPSRLHRSLLTRLVSLFRLYWWLHLRSSQHWWRPRRHWSLVSCWVSILTTRRRSRSWSEFSRHSWTPIWCHLRSSRLSNIICLSYCWRFFCSREWHSKHQLEWRRRRTRRILFFHPGPCRISWRTSRVLPWLGTLRYRSSHTWCQSMRSSLLSPCRRFWMRQTSWSRTSEQDWSWQSPTLSHKRWTLSWFWWVRPHLQVWELAVFLREMTPSRR